MTIGVGVSIAIPEPYGEFLRAKRRSYGDVLADRIPSHITLAPPVLMEESGLERTIEDLHELAGVYVPFTVSLLGTGTFRPTSPVVFVAVSEGIAQIETLAQGVRTAIDAPESQFPFHPHVTVAHHVEDEALDTAMADLRDFRASFEVEAVHLYLDDPERGWVPTQRFELG